MPLGLTFRTVRIIGSRVCGSTEKSSIAPRSARMPNWTPRPRKPVRQNRPRRRANPCSYHDLSICAYVYEKRDLLGEMYANHGTRDYVPAVKLEIGG